MELRILGPVEMWADGQRHYLGPPKQRALVAVLALDPNRPVPAETLIDRMWGDQPPEKVRDTLTSYASRLRRVLAGSAGSPRLVADGGGYLLEIDQEDIDLHRFYRRRDQGRTMAESGDDEEALRLFREAEGLRRGEPLGGFDSARMTHIRERIDDEFRTATLERVELELRLGRHATLVGELAELTAAHPYDERFVEHRMLALFRCGRQADALEEYERTRIRLREALGADPGSRLRELHQRILRGEPELAAPPVRAPARPAGLPMRARHFVGRAEYMDDILYESDQSVTGGTLAIGAIGGMPGVGKTALAVELAHTMIPHYPDGQVYLDLRAHDPVQDPLAPAAALEALLREFQVPNESIPGALDERASMWRTLLAHRRAIVLLDDAFDIEQVRPLLPGSSTSLLLITSRRLLELPGVRTVSLDVLPVEDAIDLFTRVVGDTARTAEPTEVSRIVRLCGNLPLAIQVSAGQLRHRPAWSIADLTSRLVERNGTRGVTRHVAGHEVATAFDLSYRELTPTQQRAFRLLSLHTGLDFSSHAAAAILATGPREAKRTLDQLVDYHLLREPRSDRFRFHDLLRDFAIWHAERDSTVEIDGVRRRLLDFYLDSADRADRALYPHRDRLAVRAVQPPIEPPLVDEAGDARDWLNAELVNVLSVTEYAAAHGWIEHATLLPHVLAKHLDVAARWDDAASALGLALAASRELDDRRGVAQASLALAHAEDRRGDTELALRLGNDALTIARDLGDQRHEARAIDLLGVICWHRSHYRESLARAQQALALYRAADDRRGQAEALSHAALPLIRLGRYDEAFANLWVALRTHRGTGDRQEEIVVMNNIGELHQERGYYRDALEFFEEALARAQEIGGPQKLAILYSNIGTVHHYRGYHEEALDYHRRALAAYRATGDGRSEADVLNSIGEVLQDSDHHAEALIHHRKSVTIARTVGDVHEQVRALNLVGSVHRAEGRFQLSIDAHTEALRMARRIGEPQAEGQALYGLGGALLNTRGEAAARAPWEEALAIFTRLGVPDEAPVRVRLQALGATGS